MRGSRKKTQEEIWKYIQEQCARFKIEAPQKSFFTSQEYILKQVDASLPACIYVPQGHTGLLQMDVVLDTNSAGIGRPPTIGFRPRVIVVFGFAKFLNTHHRGVVEAWVGDAVRW